MSSGGQVSGKLERMTAPPRLAPSAWLALYRRMQLIRLSEERLARSHQRGLIHGACHTYVGQEAIAAGVCAHLRAADAVFSTHRGHGHALAKGLEPRRLFAERGRSKQPLSTGGTGQMYPG
jgi:2-oxoisovalerate dehydrogenase E1 component